MFIDDVNFLNTQYLDLIPAKLLKREKTLENEALSSLLQFKPKCFLLILVFTFICLYLGTAPILASGQTAQQKDSSWFIDIGLYSQSAHAPLACEKCHADMQEDGKEHPDSNASDFLKKEATRKYDYSRCESCHMQAYKRYLQGDHAELLKEQDKLAAGEIRKKPLAERAPTCGNCHSVHYQPPGQSRIQTGKRMVQVCGQCHPENTKSYLDDFHGRAAVDLENEKSAYCTDCHGAHSTKDLEEDEEALRACKRCHLQAKDKFAGYVVHASVPSQKAEQEEGQDKLKTMYILNIIKGIVSAVVILVLIFFFAISLLWMLRELHEKLRKH